MYCTPGKTAAPGPAKAGPGAEFINEEMITYMEFFRA